VSLDLPIPPPLTGALLSLQSSSAIAKHHFYPPRLSYNAIMAGKEEGDHPPRQGVRSPRLPQLPHGHGQEVAEAAVGSEDGGGLEAAVDEAVLAAGIVARAQAVP